MQDPKFKQFFKTVCSVQWEEPFQFQNRLFFNFYFEKQYVLSGLTRMNQRRPKMPKSEQSFRKLQKFCFILCLALLLAQPYSLFLHPEGTSYTLICPQPWYFFEQTRSVKIPTLQSDGATSINYIAEPRSTSWSSRRRPNMWWTGFKRYFIVWLCLFVYIFLFSAGLELVIPLHKEVHLKGHAVDVEIWVLFYNKNKAKAAMIEGFKVLTILLACILQLWLLVIYKPCSSSIMVQRSVQLNEVAKLGYVANWCYSYWTVSGQTMQSVEFQFEVCFEWTKINRRKR